MISGREGNYRRKYFIINLRESMVPGRDRTRDPLICSQADTLPTALLGPVKIVAFLFQFGIHKILLKKVKLFFTLGLADPRQRTATYAEIKVDHLNTVAGLSGQTCRAKIGKLTPVTLYMYTMSYADSEGGAGGPDPPGKSKVAKGFLRNNGMDNVGSSSVRQ